MQRVKGSPGWRRVSRYCWLHYQRDQTHTGDPHKNDTLECWFSDKSGFVYCAWNMKTILSFDPARYEVIEMANSRRSVGREQGACLDFINHLQVVWRWGPTVNTSQPVSAFFNWASRKVFLKTSFSFEIGGLGHECGFRRLNKCLIDKGRCLTILSFPAGQDITVFQVRTSDYPCQLYNSLYNNIQALNPTMRQDWTVGYKAWKNFDRWPASMLSKCWNDRPLGIR